jgi:hypothetical protein
VTPPALAEKGSCDAWGQYHYYITELSNRVSRSGWLTNAWWTASSSAAIAAQSSPLQHDLSKSTEAARNQTGRPQACAAGAVDGEKHCESSVAGNVVGWQFFSCAAAHAHMQSKDPSCRLGHEFCDLNIWFVWLVAKRADKISGDLKQHSAH